MVGAKKAFPGRQVISLSGDGGLSMLMGDLLTAVQEKIPIKIAVFNNGSLGFVELEMKVEGPLDTYTNLENPEVFGMLDALRMEANQSTPHASRASLSAWTGSYPSSGSRVSPNPISCCPCHSGVTRRRSLAGALVLVTARRSRPAAKPFSATIVCALLPSFAIVACPSAARLLTARATAWG
jgi:hypothetical protein